MDSRQAPAAGSEFPFGKTVITKLCEFLVACVTNIPFDTKAFSKGVLGDVIQQQKELLAARQEKNLHMHMRRGEGL